VNETYILAKVNSEDEKRLSGNAAFPAPRKSDLGRKVAVTRECLTWKGKLGYFKDDLKKTTTAFYSTELVKEVKHIPMVNWGKDHWSTFAYIETLAVENKGIAIPDGRRMRTILKKHSFSTNDLDSSEYATRLKTGEISNHDDWDCVEDAIREGLLEEVGTPTKKSYKLTTLGQTIAGQLRTHKMKGGVFGDFKVMA